MGSITDGMPVGAKFLTKGRTIGQGDFSLLTNMTWTTESAHADAEYAKTSVFGKVVLPGPCTLAVAVGLCSTCDVQPVLENKYGVRLVGLLGYDSVAFKGPLFAGDTIKVEMGILGVRATKKPNRGVMRFKLVTKKHTGEVILEAVKSSLYERINPEVP